MEFGNRYLKYLRAVNRMSTNSTSSWTRKRRNFVWNRYFSLPAREDSFFASCRAAWKGFAQCKGIAQSSVRERGCSLECLRKFTAECERSKHSSSSSASARPESLPCNASRTESPSSVPTLSRRKFHEGQLLRSTNHYQASLVVVSQRHFVY